MNGFAAVIFDLGGVVLGSPLAAFRDYESELGIPVGFLARMIVQNGSSGAWERLERGELDMPSFDVFIESAREGLRKPDPRIYQLACARLQVSPASAVFLDDIGQNLKPARQLGMATIKVVDPALALVELGRVLGLALHGG